jgi:hypothetical protein
MSATRKPMSNEPAGLRLEGWWEMTHLVAPSGPDLIDYAVTKDVDSAILVAEEILTCTTATEVTILAILPVVHLRKDVVIHKNSVNSRMGDVPDANAGRDRKSPK